jgi:hypothetical protein
MFSRGRLIKTAGSRLPDLVILGIRRDGADE